MLESQNAAHRFHEIEQAHARKERRKALSDPEAFIKLAAAGGYEFTVENLETQLDQLSDEDVAGIFNPGIPPRRHLFPR
ncbi:Nif11 family protein [Leptolyngbya cf. ectocarpi LEGE 11479]|uniref:Nif11 family protein n=1 Tax=Leptolyngbya cf. ectocarpi LEGE 11479 TaxID=1828722 RepID=A0A928WYN9_LEPEC|nr:Nif11 family protein [Leptolyngbya ectocarpi]MBE9065829.1 Nif11 family protein [Leptolyngbya cf. ectocarpi LEGE 11479]